MVFFSRLFSLASPLHLVPAILVGTGNLKLQEIMKFRMAIRIKLFLSHALAVLLVSGSIGTYFSRVPPKV